MDDGPRTLGLTLCRRVVVDERTGQPSLLEVLTGLGFEDFPTSHVEISACAALTGTAGECKIELWVLRAATGERVYRQSGSLIFEDRTDVLFATFRTRRLAFAFPGYYLFQLRADGEPIPGAERWMRAFRR